jgi:hypothetical protein
MTGGEGRYIQELRKSRKQRKKMRSSEMERPVNSRGGVGGSCFLWIHGAKEEEGRRRRKQSEQKQSR